MSAAPPRGAAGFPAVPVCVAQYQYSDKQYPALFPGAHAPAERRSSPVAASLRFPALATLTPPTASAQARRAEMIRTNPAAPGTLASRNSKAATHHPKTPIPASVQAPLGVRPFPAGEANAGSLPPAPANSEASTSSPCAASNRSTMPATFGGVGVGFLRRISGCVGAFASYVRAARATPHRSACSAEPSPDACPVSSLRKRSVSALFPLPLVSEVRKRLPPERPLASPHSEPRRRCAAAERDGSVPQFRSCRTSAGVLPRRWSHNASATARVGGDRGRGQGDALP